MANSWRMSGDVYDSFSRPDVRCPCTGDEPGYVCQLPGFHCSILNIMNKQARIVSKTQSGAQNDMDMYCPLPLTPLSPLHRQKKENNTNLPYLGSK